MSLGKQIRLNRLFAHPSGRLCSVAVDHFMGYGEGLPGGLRHIQSTIDAVMAAQPDAVTMHKGVAAACWGKYAGKVPMILQSTLARAELPLHELIIDAEEAVRLGADAIACAAFIRGDIEGVHLSHIAALVRDAARFDMPVIFHIYPRHLDGTPRVSFEPEDIAWAVRCAVEVGADVVKTPYCGDIKAHAQIVADCPVPLVAAGGPKSGSLYEALTMMGEVVASGALGATIGRNIWGFPQITAAVNAFKAVIHDNATADEAMRMAGLEPVAA